MIATLIFTAIMNLVLDRMLQPLELYLGVDVWQEQEVPLLAEEDDIPPDDQAALHAAAHGRRLGLKRLPAPVPRILSDLFDGIVSNSRDEVNSWLHDPSSSRGDEVQSLKEEDLAKVYLAPALTSKTPKLWIPKDDLGASKKEIELNEKVGLTTTDDGAEIDENGNLHWDHRFENVPIWSKPKQI